MRYFFCSLIFLLGFNLPSFAQDCLKFSNMHEKNPILNVLGPNFKKALEDAGICVELIPVPSKREISGLKNGEFDGILMRAPGLKKHIGYAGIMLNFRTIKTSGLLVTFNKELTLINKLDNHLIGIARGSVWSKKVLSGYENYMEVGEREQLVKMLNRSRLDAILLDSLTFQAFEKELRGAFSTEVIDLSGYTWLRADLRHRANEIERAIQAYRAKGKTLLDKIE